MWIEAYSKLTKLAGLRLNFVGDHRLFEIKIL